MEKIKSGVFAGICIGIAGFGYLAEKSIIGAVLFAFGLLTVVAYKLKLYTGTAGFIKRNELGSLVVILLANIVGCMIVSLIARFSPLPLQDTAEKIIEGRLSVGPLGCGILAIGCGMIMTTAVNFARKGNYLPLLFGVPLFITCGFPHCVADVYYLLTCRLVFISSNWLAIVIYYVSIVVGNFAGCNLYRLFVKEEVF